MTEDEVKLMTINNAQINDTGTYLCRVLNEYGFVDLLHHLNVLPGALRPTLPPIRHQIAGMVEELIIAITSVIAILIFSFTLFLIYHCRNQKSLRRSLLATRILATGGSENLKGNPIYRSEFESKTKRPLLEDGCRRFPTEATISTIISSYYDDQCEFSREKLIMGHLLGKGAFGFVYQAIAYNIIPGEQSTTVAVKTVRDDATTDEIENLLKELAVMKMVGKHPNIINLFGCCTKGGQVMLIVEYAKYGNLRDYLRCKRPSGHVLSGSFESEENDDYHVDEIIDTLTTLDLLLFCLQVASGMDYLHSKKCIHRDLAARNVLLAENRVCKICDFGLARDLTQNYYYRKQTDGRVPVKWMSPEALFDRKFSTKSDIWSFAILAWEIMTYGGTPYPSVPAEKLFDYLRDGSRMSKPANCPNEMYERAYSLRDVYILSCYPLSSFKIIENCWEFKENLRPSFQQVCERLQRYLYGTSPIDYSDLDYVDLPLSPSTSDFAQTLFPTSTRTTTRTNDDIGSSIPSTITTAATSSSSLT
ncbi:unnamed protein product [Didymodactylos carnosus]|uniref:Protein kinase domain-containing protein n=1 Tax=Didymodactylos carnosus TaxID=1234261 RepID=A0A8S2HRT9_9BILA|nr:unnamed protein product [Didymodactylos carnosus]CAF3677259.1 unnamed protein product [Didymodactylos carnosus]